MKKAPLLLSGFLAGTLVMAQSPQPPPARQPLPPPVEQPPTHQPPAPRPIEPPPADPVTKALPVPTPPPGAPPPVGSAASGVADLSRFESIDTNHDGYVSLEEFGGSHQDVQAQDGHAGFAILDKNGDGRISPEEWAKRVPAGKR